MSVRLALPARLALADPRAFLLIKRAFFLINREKQRSHPLTFAFLTNLFERFETLQKVTGTAGTVDNIKPSLNWDNAEAELKTCSIVLNLTLDEMVNAFVEFLDTLPALDSCGFDQIQTMLYEKECYPLAEHLVYALKDSGVARRRAVLSLVDSIKLTNARYGDLGVGPGLIYTDVLKRKDGWIGVGMDISVACIKHTSAMLTGQAIRNGDNLVQADLRELPFPSGYFDVLTAVEVLEHVPTPSIGMKEIARTLRPGGYALFGIPLRMNIPTHLFIFQSEDEIKESLTAEGFKIERAILQDVTASASDLIVLCRLGG